MAVIDLQPVPAKHANFTSKGERKAYRKGRVRAAMANKVAEVRLEGQDRAAFYRNLRHMKIRRRRIAAEMGVLADLVDSLGREVRRLGDRVPDIDAGYYSEAEGLLRHARSSTESAAEDWLAFSRRKIIYTKVVA